MSRKLLWIDDDGKARFPFECRKLRLAGYEIDWAKSGAEAEAAFRVETYEVVLLDQQLPWEAGLSEVWGGVLLYAWARGSQRPANAPPVAGFDSLFERPLSQAIGSRVLVISAFYDEGVTAARRELGLPDRDVLPKPVDIDSLFRLLEESEE